MEPEAIKFGTDGWRAVIGNGFTFDNVALVTEAIAAHLHPQFGTSKPVVVGYDTRFQADAFARHAAEKLASYGFSVLITEQYTPTPAVAYAAKGYDTAGALMFTASHNPPEYCGIKFIPDYAGPATPEITNALVALVKDIQAGKHPGLPVGQKGTIETFDPYARYLEELCRIIDFEALKASPIKILYDPMYGAGQAYMDRIFREKAGYGIDQLHNHRDPLFGGHLPEPKPEHLAELMARVPRDGYTLGIASDGDADRLGAVDETGHYLPTNLLLPLLLRYLYTRREFRGSTVRTVATSMLIDCVADKYGITVHETPVGFKYVGDWMRKEPIIVGGEESGGLSVLGHIPEKDGILGAFLLTEMLAREGKTLSQLLADLYQELGLKLHNISINLHLEQPQKQALMEAAKKLSPGDTFAGRPIQSIETMDGVKLIFNSYDWMLLRPSGTEPILRLYGESPDEQEVAKFQPAVETLIRVPSLSG